MDIISHILIGRLISFKKSRITQIWTMVFSYLPDLSQLPYYLFLGYENARPFLFPKNTDWINAKEIHPILDSLWQISHSFFFVFLIILPIILFFKLPKIAFVAYIVHLIIDIPTHMGEWAIKPFYPLSFSISGLTDVWAWPFWLMSLCWFVLAITIMILDTFKEIKNANTIKQS